MIASVQWYRRPARSNDSQIRGHPSRMIIGKDGNSLARRHVVTHQPTADGLRQSTQFGVGVALNAVRLLDLNRNILRPALSAFDEAIVKSGHRCGKYTRKQPVWCGRLAAFITEADIPGELYGDAIAVSANIRSVSNMLGFYAGHAAIRHYSDH